MADIGDFAAPCLQRKTGQERQQPEAAKPTPEERELENLINYGTPEYVQKDLDE